jgi:hypothetical protein
VGVRLQIHHLNLAIEKLAVAVVGQPELVVMQSA